MKKKIIICIVSILVFTSLIFLGYKILNKDTKREKTIETKEHKLNVIKEDAEISGVVDTVLNDKKIKSIKNKNDKINKTIQMVIKEYNGNVDPNQVKRIVIDKIG